MSRIPPASIRLTSGALASSTIGTSTYYYNSQLKANISLDKVTQMLGQVAGFPVDTSSKRRGAFPWLRQEILPIQAQLRAKRLFTLLLTRSHSWFSSKMCGIFDSSLTTLINSSNCQVKVVDQRPPLKGVALVSKQCAFPLATVKWLCNTTRFRKQKAAFSPSCRQTLLGYKKTKIEFSKRVTFLFRHTSGSVLTKCIPKNLLQQPLVSHRFNATISDPKVAQQHSQKRLVHKVDQGVNQESSQLIRPKNRRRSVLPLPGQSLQELNGGNQRKKTVHRGFWQRPSLFMWLCLQQTFGKQVHLKSNSLLVPALRQKFRNITEKKKSRSRKMSRPNYDFHFIEQLDQYSLTDSQKAVRFRCTHYPRTGVDHLTYDPVLPSDLSKGPTYVANTTRAKVKRNTRLRIDNLTSYSNNNVTPKLLVCRTYKAPVRLNLFSFLEGHFSKGRLVSRSNKERQTPNHGPWQRPKWTRKKHFNTTYPVNTLENAFHHGLVQHNKADKAGFFRQKSGVTFQLDLRLDSLKSLRPTLSIRL